VDVVARLLSLEPPNSAGFGTGWSVWVYDSTNSKIYTMGTSLKSTTLPADAATIALQTNTYTYSGSGNPSFSSTTNTYDFGAYGISEYAHMKIVKVSGSINYQISIDGGATYTTIKTQSVGTLSKCGYSFYSYGGTDILNVISEVIN